VIPFGQATETIAFGAGLRRLPVTAETITLAKGQIFIEENIQWANGPWLPASPNPVERGTGTLTDVITGGRRALPGGEPDN